MNLLCLETATAAGSVALVRDGHVVSELVATTNREHTETLLPTAQVILREAECTIGELDAIVVDVGPGLFTGLRVGVATARSLAASAGIGLISVTSLEVLAHDPALVDANEVWCVIDGRRGEVFVQQFVGAGRAPSFDPEILRPELFAERMAAQDLSGVAFAGDGVSRYRELFDHLDQQRSPLITIPSPGVAGVLAEQRRSAGVDPTLVVPLYLRDPDAVANFSVAPKGSHP